jgi:hypothetical protein
MAYSAFQAVKRLKQWVGHGAYGLGKGDKDSKSDTPFEYVGSAPDGLKRQADCIAAVLWAYGAPRHHPDFPEYEGDINVDSALMDAGCIKGDFSAKKFFRELADGKNAAVGDILMFPSVRAAELHDTTQRPDTRIRIGHTGLVAGFRDDKPTNRIADMVVLECSGGYPAVKLGFDKNFSANDCRESVYWSAKHQYDHNWRTRIVQYIGP